MSVAFDFNISAQEFADMLPTGVAILDQNDESIMVNRRFRELMTCSSARSFECWSQSIHPDDLDRIASAYFETTRSKRALRIEFRTHSRIPLWRVLALAPLDEVDMHRLNLINGGFICTIADITHEKTAELLQVEIAREAQERKQQQERFIDMISHEVRNPLSAILHCTEDILEAVQNKGSSGLPVADIAQAAETISFCVAHQKKIVDDVLTFSKLDASMLTLSPRRDQPKRHFARTLSIFRPELRKQDIQFEFKLDNSYSECGIEWVLADLSRMGQVLINLVSNAIKFTAKADSKREIRVSMGASTKRPPSYPPNVVFFEPSESALRLDATSAPEWGEGQVAYVMVAVKDTGIGISDQDQKRLFERFNQATPRTESVYGGSGLGLNVSRKLCHLHGGEIGVSSKEAEGSTFGFFFRVRRDDEPYNPVLLPNYDKSEIDELCGGIQALSNKVIGVNDRTKSPEISENPVVTHIAEVAPGAASDDKYIHTLEIAHQAKSNKPSASEHELLHDDPNVDRTSKSPEGSAVLGGKADMNLGHVLVVEDNIINRQIVSRKLQSLKFHISEATNGQQALNAVQREEFDCILMDQEMPVMDGNSATMAIRNLDRAADTPILGVTANVRASQQKEMLHAGMDDIIHKPYRTNDLFEKINQLIVLRSKK